MQTATTLPGLLFAMPAGVLADAFDRRWLLFGVQVFSILVALSLFFLTATGQMSPPLLLVFTFLVGTGTALQVPTWQSLISELVPRVQLPAATRLDMISVNLSRAVGPALAGLVIGLGGVASVFALNAVCCVVLVGVLIAWQRPLAHREVKERFLPAMRTGGRYVRHDQVVRRILVRLAVFVVPASAMWALLPLVADQRLHTGSSGYGLMFVPLGVGAVLGSLTLGRLQRRRSANAVTGLSTVAFGVALAALALCSSLLLALGILLVLGYFWTAWAASVMAELQLALPSWVRARVLAAYMMTFQGCQALGGPLWGQVATHAGLSAALLVAAAVAAAGVFVGRLMPVPEGSRIDPTPVAYWGSSVFEVETAPTAGPVLVVNTMVVDPQDEEAFVAAMQLRRTSRLRSGATDWALYRVAEDAHEYAEVFAVASWGEHLRQHEGRMTAADRRIEQAAFHYVHGDPVTRHLVPPGT